jgi:hypothetical protein
MRRAGVDCFFLPVTDAALGVISFFPLCAFPRFSVLAIPWSVGPLNTESPAGANVFGRCRDALLLRLPRPQPSSFSSGVSGPAFLSVTTHIPPYPDENNDQVDLVLFSVLYT